jgi:hypothetical protein
MNYFAAETAPLLRYAKQNGGADLSGPHCFLPAAPTRPRAFGLGHPADLRKQKRGRGLAKQDMGARLTPTPYEGRG